MQHVKMCLPREKLGFFHKTRTTIQRNKYFIELLKGHRAVAQISNDSVDLKKRRIKMKKAQLKRKLTRLLTKCHVLHRLRHVYGTNFDRKRTLTENPKRILALRRKTVDILLETRISNLKNRRLEASIDGKLIRGDNRGKALKFLRKAPSLSSKIAVFTSNFYALLRTSEDKFSPGENSQKFHRERSEFWHKTSTFLQERKIKKPEFFRSAYKKHLHRLIVAILKPRTCTQQKQSITQGISHKREKSESKTEKIYLSGLKSETVVKKQKVDSGIQQLTEKSKNVRKGLENFSNFAAGRSNKENFDRRSQNLVKSIKDYCVVIVNKLDKFKGDCVPRNYLPIKANTRPVEIDNTPKPVLLASVDSATSSKKVNADNWPGKLQQEQKKSEIREPKGAARREARNRLKTSLKNLKSEIFCCENSEKNRKFSIFCCENSEKNRKSSIFWNEKGKNCKNGNRGKKREQKKRGTVELRGKLDLKRKVFVRIPSLYWILMANFVWWCFDTANCVQVQQNEKTCPTECDCYNDLKEIYCEDRGLHIVPIGIPSSVRKLSLAGNNITEFPKNIFRDSTSLEELILNRNIIAEIPTSAFTGLSNLRVLDLSDNQLTQVPTNAIFRLGKIEELRLRNNPIKEILNCEFIRIRKTLMTLDLGGLTKLKFLSREPFCELDRLQVLYMDSSNLSEIPGLQQLQNLQKLIMSGNKIGIVPRGAFSRLPRLRLLDMSKSQIRMIRLGAFEELESLQFLDVSGNQMTTMTEGMFSHNDILQQVLLRDNPWNCNCDLLWLAGWLTDYPYTCTEETCPKCRYPVMYNGMNVANLTNIESPPCSLIISPTPTTVTVPVGNPVKLPCPTIAPFAETLNGPNLHWNLPNGTLLKREKTLRHGQYEVKINVLKTGSLNISSVSLEDGGQYTCSVMTPSGQVTNSTVYLNVTDVEGVLRSSFFHTVTTTMHIGPTKPQISTKTKLQKTQPTKSPRKSTTSTKNIRTTPRTIRTWTTSSRPGAVMVPSTKSKLPPISNATTELSTTRIIIGCFVGITLLAAALLVIFYKMRKRSYSRDQELDKKRHNRQPGNPVATGLNEPIKYQNTIISTAQSSLIGRIADEQQSFIADQASDLNTGPTTMSVESSDTQPMMPEAYWKDSYTPYHQQYAKQNEVRNDTMPPVTSHILPPPPEEMFMGGKRYITSPSLINMTSQQSSTTSQSKQQSLTDADTADETGPLEQGYDSLRFMKMVMPPAMKPVNGMSQFKAGGKREPRLSTSQRDLLHDLASSCQKVALNRHPSNMADGLPSYSSLDGVKHAKGAKGTSLRHSVEWACLPTNEKEVGHLPPVEHPQMHPGSSLTYQPGNFYTLRGTDRGSPCSALASGACRRYSITFDPRGQTREQPMRRCHGSAINLAQTKPPMIRKQQRATSSRLLDYRPDTGFMHATNERSGYQGNQRPANQTRSLRDRNECLQQQLLQRKIPIKIKSFDGILTRRETEI